MHAGNAFSQPSKHRLLHQPVAEGRRPTPKTPDKIRFDQPPVPPADTSFRSQLLLPGEHQVGKIDFVLMWRRVGTVIKTQLAVVALIDNLAMIFSGQPLNVPFVFVDPAEQRVERRTEIEAPATAVADLIDAQRLLLELYRVDRTDETQAFHVLDHIPWKHQGWAEFDSAHP